MDLTCYSMSCLSIFVLGSMVPKPLLSREQLVHSFPWPDWLPKGGHLVQVE